MVNTADAGRRAYGNERNHGRRNRRKLSSVMAMVLGALVTIEIMIMGAMAFGKSTFIRRTGLLWLLVLWYYTREW